MDKVLLFTHGIDIDGYGCAILAKTAFGENVDIHYADNFELDEKFSQCVYGVSAKDILNGSVDKQRTFEHAKKVLKNYDQVFITDHCLSFPFCKFVNEDKDTLKKLLILDHHASRKDEQGQFSWVKIIDDLSDNTKACGTNLFYLYLVNEGKIVQTPAITKFVRYTALYDTWTWKNSSCAGDCLKLDILGKALPREEYVEHFVERFSKNDLKDFAFTKEEEKIIKNYRLAYEKKLDEYINKIKIINFDNFKAGYVHIKDLFKNDIAEKVRSLPIAKEIDFMLMPVDDRESVSLRNINPNCDVSKIAQNYGGGGHFAAASFPKQNLKIKDEKRFR